MGKRGAFCMGFGMYLLSFLIICMVPGEIPGAFWTGRKSGFLKGSKSVGV